MKEIFKKALQFIQENPRIIYSLILIIIVPTAIFYNTYYITNNFQKNIDAITLRKTAMAEDIINILARDFIREPNKIVELLETVNQGSKEIDSINILLPDANKEKFNVVASSDNDLIGKESANSNDFLAWNKPEGIAFLYATDTGRFWNVTKVITDENNQKLGLISLSFSLADSDALINATITKSYWVLLITILIILLLVSNQTRLFGYALMLSKLREVDKMKDTFISMASHELRSPLTAIKGYLEFFNEKNKNSTDAEGQHYLDNISISVDRLGSLVNDILDVSRLEGNQIPVNITDIDPSSIIAQSIEEIRSQAVQKGLALNYVPSETQLIKADTDRLKQILINIIGNSIKYTPAGKIDVSTQVKDQKFLITVADTGLGISAEDQVNLFQKFHRIQNEKTKDIIGTGLGLWITLELAKKMHGNITVESIEGVGSHFIISLPLA